jgi:hypothetical protein
VERSLDETERECVKRLAQLYAKGQTMCTVNDLAALGLTPENYVPVLGTMEHIGAIARPTHTAGGTYRAFNITAVAVQIDREIERQESRTPEAPNIVEQTKSAISRHPLLGYVVVALIALSFLLILINNLMTLLERFGLVKFK